MARNSEIVGRSENINDLTRDQQVLNMMKEIENRLQGNLVSVRIDDSTIVTTTKDRIEQLIRDHRDPPFISR